MTVLVNDPSLIAELDQAEVRYAAVPQNNWLSAVLSGACRPVLRHQAVLMKKMAAGGMHTRLLEVGKSKVKVDVQNDTSVKFEDARASSRPRKN